MKNRIKRSHYRRALASIFASLILIAIAISGGIVVYMYTSGYLSGMTGTGRIGQEQIVITGIIAFDGNDTVILYCKSWNGGDVVIEAGVLKDGGGQTLDVVSLSTPVTLSASGDLEPIRCVFTTDLVDEATYVVVLVSQAGNQFTSLSFKI